LNEFCALQQIGRSINRIAEQYAVIANCHPTRASYSPVD